MEGKGKGREVKMRDGGDDKERGGENLKLG